jgi:hypothetical protein
LIIDVISREDGSIQQAPLALDENGSCKIRLELAAGASAVQVVVRDTDKVVLAMEVAAQPGEDVTIEFRCDSAGAIHATARNRPFLVLPDEKPPEPLLLSPPAGNELDLAILIDGTCLHPTGTDPDGKATSSLDYLLSPALTKEWRIVVSELAEFASIVAAKYSNIWATTMAFGDEPMPDLANALLTPAYLVFPISAEDRQLRFTPPGQIVPQLSAQLLKTPYSPGGDFVDGLADGLRAVRELLWRQSSRKLLLIFGQSPGYSVLDPADELANLIPRTVCVEEEITLLHQKGIEVMTIFHHPSEAEERYSRNMPHFFQHSRRQFANLASLREWNATSPEIDVSALAAQWLNPPATIARGPSPGSLIKP